MKRERNGRNLREPNTQNFRCIKASSLLRKGEVPWSIINPGTSADSLNNGNKETKSPPHREPSILDINNIPNETLLNFKKYPSYSN
jgi:hypothetical protein